PEIQLRTVAFRLVSVRQFVRITSEGNYRERDAPRIFCRRADSCLPAVRFRRSACRRSDLQSRSPQSLAFAVHALEQRQNQRLDRATVPAQHRSPPRTLWYPATGRKYSFILEARTLSRLRLSRESASTCPRPARHLQYWPMRPRAVAVVRLPCDNFPTRVFW